MSPDSGDILAASIPSAARAVRSGEVDPLTLANRSLQRIEATAGLAAWTDVDADDVLRQAAMARDDLATGRDRGVLHGIPVAVKDNVDLAGRRTTAGSRVLDRLAAEDADVVARLREAGAIVVGRTNMHELAWGGTTANPHFGTARNPWDPGRSPGGSSGGAAIAVATRAVYAAVGTDTGGSIRLPAALCGVTGLRPTPGVVSDAGVFPLAWTLDVTGPIARSAADCALVLQAMTGTAGATVLSEALDASLPPLRVGRPRRQDLRAQAAVTESFDAVLDIVRGLGVEVREIDVPEADILVDTLLVVNAAEPSALHHRAMRERPQDFGPDVLAQLRAGEQLSAVEYVQAQRLRTHLSRAVSDLFREIDLLLTPTVPFTVPHIGQGTFEVGGITEHLHQANMHFNALASLAGLPALSIPMGFDDSGLPMGLQVVGAPHDEFGVMRLGHHVQQVTDHHLRSPGQVGSPSEE